MLVLVVGGCAGSSRKAVGVSYLEPLPSGWSVASTIEHDCAHAGTDANYRVRWVALDVSGGQDEALDRFAEHISDAGLDLEPAEALAFEPWRSVHGTDGEIEIWAGTQSSFHDAAAKVNGIEFGARDWEPTVADAEVIVRLQPVGPCQDRPT
jgi:hypothetical protein